MSGLDSTPHSDRADDLPDGAVSGEPDADAAGASDSTVASAPSPAGDRDAPVVLEIEGVRKAYGDETVLEGLSLVVREGEFLTLLGPSGCGKTTTLHLIAGLERPAAGTVRLDGETVADGDGTFVEPERRDVGVVFQDFALFPHLSAAENVAFGIQDRPADERERRVEELLSLVGLVGHGDSRPEELSGGQQQRVALARALAPEPDVLLLDEPFSNLDVDLRVEMREEVRSIVKRAGVTAVSVTHDQEEALSISDRVAVVGEGRIEQVGAPETVFQHPSSRFVAGFLGHANFLSAHVRDGVVQTPLGAVDPSRVPGLAEAYEGAAIDVLVRPDDAACRPADEESADGVVTYRHYVGPTVRYRVALESGDTVECTHNHAEQIGLDRPVAVELVADHELAWFPTAADQ